MQKEISSLEDNQVWDLVELPKGKKVIGRKWIFKRKIDVRVKNVVRSVFAC